MQPIPKHIIDFILANHIVSFACENNGELWAASCFYAFDAENGRLIMLTKQTTQHGSMLLNNPKIAGTIAGQVGNITQIEGIQFSGTARLLEDEPQAVALRHYYAKHPMARLMQSDVWEIRLERIKHTGNKVVFAKKSEWHRNAN